MWEFHLAVNRAADRRFSDDGPCGPDRRFSDDGSSGPDRRLSGDGSYGPDRRFLALIAVF